MFHFRYVLEQSTRNGVITLISPFFESPIKFSLEMSVDCTTYSKAVYGWQKMKADKDFQFYWSKYVGQKRLAKKLAPNSIIYSKLQSATYQTWLSNGATEKIYRSLTRIPNPWQGNRIAVSHSSLDLETSLFNKRCLFWWKNALCVSKNGWKSLL